MLLTHYRSNFELPIDLYCVLLDHVRKPTPTQAEHTNFTTNLVIVPGTLCCDATALTTPPLFSTYIIFKNTFSLAETWKCVSLCFCILRMSSLNLHRVQVHFHGAQHVSLQQPKTDRPLQNTFCVLHCYRWLCGRNLEESTENKMKMKNK